MSRLVVIAVVLVGCGPMVVVEDEVAQPTAPADAPFQAPVQTSSRPQARAAPRVQAPFISRFGPSQGIVGTRVSVLGSGFSTVPHENHVFVGSVRCGVPATVVAANEALLEFEVPEGAVTNPLTIMVGGQAVVTSEPFTVLTRPLVWSVDPPTTLVGTRDHVIGITGDGFVGAPAVWLDGQPLAATRVSVDRLTAVVPFSLKTVAREAVLTVEGAGETLRLVVENPGPGITSVTPAVLHSRVDRVTVSGAGFVPTSTVLVDHQPVPTTWDSGSLVAHLPALAVGPHLVMVHTPAPGGGVSAPVTLTVE